MPTAGIEIIDTDSKNIHEYGFCGYKNVKSESHRRKAEWRKKRDEEGVRFKILHSDSDGPVGVIEYIPGEYAWRTVKADGYMFIHCIMIYNSRYKGKGYGSQLLDQCILDAKRAKMSGVAVMASRGTWMAKRDLFLANGFQVVDKAQPAFELLALKFKKNVLSPEVIANREKNIGKYKKGLTIIWSDQCPYTGKSVEDVSQAANSLGIKPELVELKSCKDARNTPSPYGTYCMIYNGEIVADHPVSKTRFLNILKKTRK